jgi:hypothetical protein
MDVSKVVACNGDETDVPLVPVSEATLRGLARTSYVIGVSNHGIIKWVPTSKN